MIPANWSQSPPEVKEIPEGWFVIMTDAGYRNSIAGICAIVRTNMKEYEPLKTTARCKGPTHAELIAIKKGLEKLNLIRKNKVKIIIYTDCLSAFNFLNFLWFPKRTYIINVTDEIADLLDEFNIDTEVIHVKTKEIKRVDRLAGKERKKEEKRKQNQIQDRVDNMEKSIIRSSDIDILEDKGIYYALSSSNRNKKYIVSLRPINCECPAWMQNWGNKTRRIQNARALPCKHMCALAIYLRIDIYDVFRHQVERID